METPFSLGLLGWEEVIHGLRKETANQIPGSKSPYDSFLVAWAIPCLSYFVEIFVFFNHKVMTNLNTMINKTWKQIVNMLWLWLYLKSHIDFFSSFFCIIKPFPSVIPKRIFLNKSFLVFFLTFAQIKVFPTFYLIEYQLSLLLWLEGINVKSKSSLKDDV